MSYFGNAVNRKVYIYILVYILVMCSVSTAMASELA